MVEPRMAHGPQAEHFCCMALLRFRCVVMTSPTCMVQAKLLLSQPVRASSSSSVCYESADEQQFLLESIVVLVGKCATRRVACDMLFEARRVRCRHRA